MKYWYQRPKQQLTEYVRTVLILEGFSESEDAAPPLFTNGMATLLCRTEKDQEGATRLYPLTDFKPRKDESLVKGYLAGRYGGIPFIPEGLKF